MSWKIKVTEKPHANAGGPDWWVGEKKYAGWYVASLPKIYESVVTEAVCVFGPGYLAMKFGKKKDALALTAHLQLAGCNKVCACRENNAFVHMELEECA